MSRLYVRETYYDGAGFEKERLMHNPMIDYVCQCPNCGEYGARNQYGRDDECPYCGTELDWSNEERW